MFVQTTMNKGGIFAVEPKMNQKSKVEPFSNPICSIKDVPVEEARSDIKHSVVLTHKLYAHTSSCMLGNLAGQISRVVNRVSFDRFHFADHNFSNADSPMRKVQKRQTLRYKRLMRDPLKL